LSVSGASDAQSYAKGNHLVNRNGRDLIIDDPDKGIFRVHRSAMTSPEIYEAELQSVFESSWLYIGHEAEVPAPGDFVRRTVANRAMFLVRGTRSGEVRAFHNTCTHRGALVCRQDSGNSKAFRCFYHAWTFNSEGKLIAVPDQDGYGETFRREDLGLRPAPRLESYRGFVFISFNPDVEDLVTYLAGAREYLDLVIDAGESGLEIIKGANQYEIKANWKLLVENSIDGYHGEPTHETYFKYLVDMGTDMGAGVSGTAHDLGNGHAVIEYSAPWGRPVAKWEALFGEDARQELAELRDRLVERWGEERAARIADLNRNLLIYPNLIINDIMAVTVRTFMPTAPDRIEINAWQLAAKAEPAGVRTRRLDSFLTFLGPGGFATPDDVEALESCQQGFRSGGVEYSDISRGMSRPPRTTDEEQMRAFWRRWREQISPQYQVVTS
jgi:p-cumate 2,3-dioxygenase alpha subunit